MFSTVNSIFEYSGHHRTLLLRAKDAQDPVAIAAFHQVYDYAVVFFLRALVKQHGIDLVVLPRLSVRRIANLDWHPNDFWKAALQKPTAVKPNTECVTVFMRSPAFSRKRALISSGKRRAEILERESLFSVSREEGPQLLKASINTSINSNTSGNTALSVLFLDDVLTSGGTLLKELDFVLANLKKIVGRRERVRSHHSCDLPTTLNPHILTLFRTPVSAKAKGNHS